MKEDISKFRSELKEAISKFRSELKEAKHRQTKWIIGAMVILKTFFLFLNKYL